MVFIEIHYKHTSVLFNTYKNTYKNPVLELCSICRKKAAKSQSSESRCIDAHCGNRTHDLPVKSLNRAIHSTTKVNDSSVAHARGHRMC